MLYIVLTYMQNTEPGGSECTSSSCENVPSVAAEVKDTILYT